MKTSFKWTLSTSELSSSITLGQSLFQKNISNPLFSKTELRSKTSPFTRCFQAFQSPLLPSLTLFFLPQYMKVLLQAQSLANMDYIISPNTVFLSRPLFLGPIYPHCNPNVAALFSVIDQICLMNIGLSFLTINLIFLMNTPPRK